jgi:hypothetical protein
MIRRFLMLLSALSLLLCMAACAMWWRSPTYHDFIHGDRASGRWWRLDSFPHVVRWATGRHERHFSLPNQVAVIIGRKLEYKVFPDQIAFIEYRPNDRVLL